MKTLSVDQLIKLSQRSEYHAVVKRAQATLAVMKAVEDRFVWSVLSPAEFEAKMEAFFAANLAQALTDAEFNESQATHARERALEAVHRATVRVLAVWRVTWEGLADRAVSLAGLRAGGNTLPKIMEEGEELEAVWEELAAAEVPLAGLSLPVFQGLLAAVRPAQREERRMRVRRQVVAAGLAVALEELWELCVRWYAVATCQLDELAREEGSIFNQIPTTHVPRYAEAARAKRRAKKAQGEGGAV